MNVDNQKFIREGNLTRVIEEKTAQLQSVNWLALAVASMALSATTSIVLQRRSLGNFFGLWAPTLLMIGVYNKLVKVEKNMERNLLH